MAVALLTGLLLPAAAGSQPGAWQPSEQGAIAPANEDYYDIDGLTIGETYYFQIRSYSEPLAKPGAVQDVQAAIVGSAVTVTWSAPQDGGEPIQYVVRLKSPPKAAPGEADSRKRPRGLLGHMDIDRKNVDTTQHL